jgi:hypothetical protein
MTQNDAISSNSGSSTYRELTDIIVTFTYQLEEIKSLLASSSVKIQSRYLSANQVEQEYGINGKTLLNRSNLPADDPRHIPSVRLGARAKKMFERKVLDRMLSTK